jgi:hypothetical protein
MVEATAKLSMDKMCCRIQDHAAYKVKNKSPICHRTFIFDFMGNCAMQVSVFQWKIPVDRGRLFIYTRLAEIISAQDVT